MRTGSGSESAPAVLESRGRGRGEEEKKELAGAQSTGKRYTDLEITYCCFQLISAWNRCTAQN
jgi:hypothetical protein